MKQTMFALLLLAFFGSSLKAQDTYYSIFNFDSFIPAVKINNSSADLQSSVLPFYKSYRSAERDMDWVSSNDSLIARFWSEKGDTVLYILAELSGIMWQESEFDIYILRFYPSVGSSEPTILSLGGIQRGSLLEAAPHGDNLLFNLVFQLSKRMLAQTRKGRTVADIDLAEHPLLRKSAYRLDNMAMLLTIATCQNVLGIEETTNAYKSAFWKEHFPGRTIFETYLLDKWVLTPSFSLDEWLFQEPHNSRLVTVTRSPHKPRSQSTQQKFYLEGIPIKGKFGFSVSRNPSSQLVVDKVDIFRLAYACGLREGDIIRRVDGSLARNQRKLIEKIYENFLDGGATVEIYRDGTKMEVVFRPLMLPEWDDTELYDDFFENDSLIDSVYDDDYYDD